LFEHAAAAIKATTANDNNTFFIALFI